MHMTNLIVTGCDAKYFPIVRGLLDSLWSFPALQQQPIGFLDAGLTAEQSAWLASRVVSVKQIGWDHDFPLRAAWEQQMPGFKVMVARPQIRDHFPGYGIYHWIDADIWIQRPEAVLEMLAAAESKALVAVPEVDRSYFKFVKAPHAWLAEQQALVACQGEEIARQLQFLPTINAGMFALHAGASHWKLYQQYLVAGLNRIAETTDQTRVVEQTALNAAVYAGKLPVVRFPSLYNWLACLALPCWNVDAGQFAEPAPPYAPISLLHLSIHVLAHPVDVPVLYAGRIRGNVKTPLSYEAAQRLAAGKSQLLAAIRGGAPRA
jgi:hypothetical protein